MNYRWIVGGNIFACILFGVVTTITFPGWLAIFDAFMAGVCFSAALHTIMLERLAGQLRSLGEVCGILHESNLGLIAKLAERDREPPSSSDDVSGLRPRIH